MFKCKICNQKEANTLPALSIHIVCSHVRKNEYESLEKYYLEHLQGKAKFCKTCGEPTKFRSLSKGYATYCSTKCAAQGTSSNAIKCKLCNHIFSSKITLSKHILSKHIPSDIDTLLAYYIKYLDKNIKPACEKCGETLFLKDLKSKPFCLACDKDLICQVCYKQYDSEFGFAYHIRDHVTNGDIQSLKEYYDTYIGKPSSCKICGSPAKFLSINAGYSEVCESRTCIVQNGESKRKRNNIEKYGVDSVMKIDSVKKKNHEHVKKTCLEKYGVEYVSQLDEVKKKIQTTVKKTMLDKYGVEYALQLDECKEKYKETCKENYDGADNPMKVKEIRDKAKKTLHDKTGYDYPLQNPDTVEKYKQTCKDKYGYDNVSKVQSVKDKKEATSFERYHVKHPMMVPEIFDRVKKAWKEKYKVDHPMQIKETRDKAKMTLLERYGFDSPLKIQEFKDKYIKTCINRYGVSNPRQTEQAKLAFEKTCMEKYGVSHISKVPEVAAKSREGYIKACRKRIYFQIVDTCIYNNLIPLFNEEDFNDESNTEFAFKCENCDEEFTQTRLLARLIPECPKCKFLRKSRLERNIFNGVTKFYHKDIISNNRKLLDGLEIDLYFPEKAFGVELNGVYWHSEDMLGKYYHLDKSNIAKQKGIKLYHFWETEILDKEEIVLSMIGNVLGTSKRIYARDCEFKVIDNSIANTFLNENHLQGRGSNQAISFGLYYDGQLVSVATFSNMKNRSIYGNRNSETSSVELLRFASLLNTSIIGGFSKLLKNAIKDPFFKEVKEIMTFANGRFTSDPENNVYRKNGFEYQGTSDPGYWYYYARKLYHRYSFTKQRLLKMCKELNIETTNDDTERSLAAKLKLFRIYDCGHHKFTYNL